MIIVNIFLCLKAYCFQKKEAMKTPYIQNGEIYANIPNHKVATKNTPTQTKMSFYSFVFFFVTVRIRRVAYMQKPN